MANSNIPNAEMASMKNKKFKAVNTLSIFILIVLEIILINNLYAYPEFAIHSGNRCSACHWNSHGSGIRTEFGWSFSRDAAALSPKEPETRGIYDFIINELLYPFSLGNNLKVNDIYDIVDRKNNSYLDSLLTFGMDFRIQTVRSNRTDDAKRRVFPMQGAIYGAISPTKWLTLDATYNVGPIFYKGQQNMSSSAFIKFRQSLPSFRIGFFQPSFGVKQCDMTSLDRRFASPRGTESFIPPDFAELGVEAVYEGLDWLTLYGGVYDSKSLEEISVFPFHDSLVQFHKNPSYLAKFMIWPSWIDDALPDAYLGASVFMNEYFWYIDGFARIGITEELSVFGNYILTDKHRLWQTNNYIAGITYIPYRGIYISYSFEHGGMDFTVADTNKYKFKTTQMVLSAKLIPVPFVEIIPEYRYVDSEESRASRWALQVHFYY